jgi:glycosyltransferase involved in cell wall biosynthesis
MAKKKLLFISRLSSPHVGGVETHLTHLISQLADEYQITLITRQHDPNLPLIELIDGTKVFRLPFHQAGSLKLATWWWILKHRQLFLQSDIIHIHDVFWWILPIWPWISQRLHITFHGYEGSQAPTSKQIFWHQLAAKMTRGNICIGDFHRQWYGVKPDIVSYGAAAVTNPKSQKQKQRAGKLKLTYIGRLHHDTGIMTYLHGLKQLGQPSKYNCDVYGDGPLRSKAEKYAQQHRLPIKFHGMVAQASARLSQADVAFVSRYLAIIEALQTGTPIIAHYNNQIKHDYLALAPFAKWIKIVNTPSQIATAIEANNPLPAEATTWAKQQTWTKVAAAYKMLWSK